MLLADSSFANSVESNTQSQTGASNQNLPNEFMVLPFLILLFMIATGPLFYKHFWEKSFPKISVLLGSVTALYYIVVMKDLYSLHHTITEYISFIALLSSLYVASGGILIKIDKESTPIANVLFLLFGAIISNVIGTTGASMLLIRPFIKMNGERIRPYHIIFFIFIVGNIGGALTPIGDPPLFLGYLSGVPFFWVIANVWYIWIPTLIMVLILFFIIDSFKNSKIVKNNQTYTGKIEFKGIRNVGYLGAIVIAVFMDPNIISFVPSLYPLPFGFRELIMFAVAFLSYKNANEKILKANEFNFTPIREVAYLFVGIFLTMIPALQLIAVFAKQNNEYFNVGLFFWASGSLSSFLDNAPTYLNFLSASMGKYDLHLNNKADVQNFVLIGSDYLRAISVGAVFFGAMTYIGNGPNFMIKSIAESSGIEMPSFMIYLFKYSIPVLLPIFTIIWILFFY